MKDRIKKATNFDGLSFVFEKDEFDAIMTALDFEIKINKEEYPDYSAMMERTKETILKYSYFNPEKMDVHTRLSYSELTNVMEALCMYTAIASSKLNNESETTFQSMIEQDTTRIWKTE